MKIDTFRKIFGRWLLVTYSTAVSSEREEIHPNGGGNIHHSLELWSGTGKSLNIGEIPLALIRCKESDQGSQKLKFTNEMMGQTGYGFSLDVLGVEDGIGRG
jgi:hypothetical protein